MLFKETKLKGVFVVEPEIITDERGFFACSWSALEFEKHGLNPRLMQCNISFNTKRGTLRGMHWQAEPHAEAKLVRSSRGTIWDVVIDLRPASPTYMSHFGVELDAASGRALYVPEGLAHGFVTLEDDCEVSYQMSEFYEPSATRGLRWNDRSFGISWPIENPILHPRDASYPDFVVEAART